MERVKIGGKTQDELDTIHAETERVRINGEARGYLRETDWYVIRSMENAGMIPDEIRQKRQVARTRVEEYTDELGHD